MSTVTRIPRREQLPRLPRGGQLAGYPLNRPILACATALVAELKAYGRRADLPRLASNTAMGHNRSTTMCGRTAPSPRTLLDTSATLLLQFVAKQYNLPVPPVALSAGLLHPWLICVEFHDTFPPPVRSEWPSMARARSAGKFGFACGRLTPSEVQLLQV